jgi:bile acid:Na+ symporter, BASS family
VTDTLVLLLKISVGITILGVGASATPADITYLWRRPGLLLRSLAAMYLLVPIAGFLLVHFWPTGTGVHAAVLVLAVSAGAPLLPRRKALEGNHYLYSLLITSTLVAIVTVPVWLALLSAYYDISVPISVGAVALVIGKTVLLPLLLGMGLNMIFPKWMALIAPRALRVAAIVLALSGVALLAVHWRVYPLIGWQGVSAFVALLIAALAIGHLMGGPEPEDRTALAVICATRHVGIALAVATTVGDRKIPVLIVGYVLTASIVSLAYSRWRHRNVHPPSVSSSA